MRKIPKGKRRANALVTRDAFELLRLVDGEGMLIDDAMKQLKLSRSRAYDLLGRARSAVLGSQNEANKKAAEVNVKRWYEAAPEPQAPQVGHDTTGFVTQSPDVRYVSTAPEVTEPLPEPVPEEADPWPWGHLMSYAEFKTRDPWRQKQLIAQWEENVVLGGKHALTLRGGPKNKNCFRGCPSYQCTCEENL
jgi:predicted DNA-binding protein (UPF0251 family)